MRGRSGGRALSRTCHVTRHRCIHARSPTPSGLSVVSVLDPASPKGMRMAPMLVMLHEALGADVTVYLMPALEMSEMPIKSYFRFVEPALAGQSPAAVFEHLPTQHILTMKVCVRGRAGRLLARARVT